jgi:hypothetical protein
MGVTQLKHKGSCRDQSVPRYCLVLDSGLCAFRIVCAMTMSLVGLCFVERSDN